MDRQQSSQLTATRAQPTRRTVSSDFKEVAFQVADSQAWSPKQDLRPWSPGSYQCQGWHVRRRYVGAAVALLLFAATAWLISRLAPCISPLQDCSREGFAARPLHSHVPRQNSQCPFYFERLSLDDLAQQKSRAYILGGEQQPECRHCHSYEKPWANFCHYRSHGPVCPPESQAELQQLLVDRAQQGIQSAKGMLSLTPCDLFPLIKGRTVWLVGDSIMQEFTKAVQCFFVEFLPDDLENVPLEHLTPDRQVLERLEGGWCARLPNDTRLCHVRCNIGNRLTETILPALGPLGAQPSDIMVLNIAVWRNKESDYRSDLRMLTDYWRAHGTHLPMTIWRDASAQHFDTPTGDFGCDGCPNATQPFKCKEVSGIRLDAAGALRTDDPQRDIIVRGGWRNAIANPVIGGMGLPIMHTWNYSVQLWQFHHHYQEKKPDCTHSCHPSGYQLWLYELYKELQALYQKLGSSLPEPVRVPVNYSSTVR